VFTSASRKIIPALALELLGAIVGRIHDFCGALEEENLRTNFVLIYELIDEIIVSNHSFIIKGPRDWLCTFLHLSLVLTLI